MLPTEKESPAVMESALAKLAPQYNDVKRVVLDAMAAIRSDEFDDYFNFFSPDAVWMMPSKSHDVGLSEAKKFYRFTKNFRFDQQITVDELLVENDVAIVRLSFDGYLRSKKDPSAAPLRSVSRHVWILRRNIAGEWLISRDIWNNPKG